VSPSQPPGSGLFSKEARNTLPTTKANLAIIYGEIDEEDVSTDNSVRVPISGLNTYLLHQYRIVNTNSKDTISILVNLQSTLAPTISPVYLQIWNVNSSTWETLTSNTTAAESVDFDLEYELTANVENYYDATHEIAIRVYQFNNESGIV
jgi:hypothetical protein